jgi:predicted transcriptional regulator
MSLAQILDELPKLTPEERQQVFLCLQALEAEPDVEATPEMLSAIDEAVQASKQGRVFTLDEVRAQAQAWIIE